MFKHGEAAEAREDYDTALDLYQKALAKAPNDLSYKTALYRVRVSASAAHMSKGRKLIEGGDEQGALVEFLHAAEIDPGNEAAQQEIAKIAGSFLEEIPKMRIGVGALGEIVADLVVPHLGGYRFLRHGERPAKPAALINSLEVSELDSPDALKKRLGNRVR